MRTIMKARRNGIHRRLRGLYVGLLLGMWALPGDADDLVIEGDLDVQGSISASEVKLPYGSWIGPWSFYSPDTGGILDFDEQRLQFSSSGHIQYIGTPVNRFEIGQNLAVPGNLEVDGNVSAASAVFDDGAGGRVAVTNGTIQGAVSIQLGDLNLVSHDGATNYLYVVNGTSTGRVAIIWD